MKKLLLSLLCLVGASVAMQADTWVRCTAVSDLTSGGTFIIGYEATANSGKIIPMKNTLSTTSTAYMLSGVGSNNKETIDMSNVAETSDYEVEIAECGEGISIKAAAGYITWKSGNSAAISTDEVELSASVDATGVFTIKKGDSRILSYNTGSPRFAFYTGSQKAPVIYKKSTVAAAVETPVFSVASGVVNAGTEVTISCETEGATIYYTTDGQNPTAESTLYTGVITINETTTLKAIAIKGSDSSSVAMATYTVPVYSSLAKVNAMANNAEFFMGSDLIVTYVNGANVYVVDNENASVAGLIYKYDLGLKEGDVVANGWAGKVSIYNGLIEMIPNGDLTVEGTANVPTPAEITAAEDVTAALMNSMVMLRGVNFAEATPRDKTNFTGTMGEGTITFRNNFQLASVAAGDYDVKAIVSVYNTNVQVLPIEYTSLAPAVTVAAPVITPNGGEVEVGTEVEITCETEDAVIYYTTDGETPTQNSTLYQGAFELDEVAESIVVKAIAYVGDVASEVTTAEFSVVEPEVVDPTVKTVVFENWLTVFGLDAEITSAAANSLNLEGTVEGVTLKVANGEKTNAYVKDADLRVYSDGYTMGFTAPENYTITGITTVKAGKSFSSNDNIETDKGEVAISSGNVTWTGEAEAINWTIKATGSFKTITVTIKKNAEDVETTNYTVYFDNAVTNWDEVYAVLSDSEGNREEAQMEINAPAEAPARVASKIYTLNIDLAFVPENIYFHNDEDDMTEDLDFNNNHTYICTEKNGDGTWAANANEGLVSIEAVKVATDTEDVYYNLQGVRVANPERGLYIRVSGNEVSKVLVK